ncbi:MAG: 2,4-dienoyl-CoA reductase-like NADH-dependent reductase (Old Yellow Enzyme family) [Arenicella sp.]|jgi:2,4-dienoyl-CoA reductase-like NADH-dependent reductase (Old Yellow Enzyme family)
MCQYSSVDGVANDWPLVHLGSRTIGGAGLIIAETTAVTPQGRITSNCAGLWNDQQIEPLLRNNSFLREHRAISVIQIGHAARKGSSSAPWDGGCHLDYDHVGWQIIGPSDQAFDQDGTRLMKKPKQMTLSDINDVQTAFVE